MRTTQTRSVTARALVAFVLTTMMALGVSGCSNYCEDLGEGWEEADGGDGSPNRCYNPDTEKFTPTPEQK